MSGAQPPARPILHGPVHVRPPRTAATRREVSAPLCISARQRAARAAALDMESNQRHNLLMRPELDFQ